MTIGVDMLAICGVSTSGCVRVRMLLCFYSMAACVVTIFTTGYYARCYAEWVQTDGDSRREL